MTSDVEYLLLKDKGPYHDLLVRRRLNVNPVSCKFYLIVVSVIASCLLLLLFSLVYVFVLLPSWHGSVLTWDGRKYKGEQPRALAHTTCGTVEGLIEDNVFVFQGIPYAAPPVGTRRWRPPERLSATLGTCWSGTLKAQRFGQKCVQLEKYGDYSSFAGGEDCLFLNVWTTSLDTFARAPVLLWLHGGSLVFGSGNIPGYSPNPDVTKTMGVVFVSFNYRLGPLGFLALDIPGDESEENIRGNYGLLDTIQVLHWVRENIANFGGDPNRMTVIGQGSGATLIHALLASPMASGLFHRAWLSSPSAILNKTTSDASRENSVFLNRTGCQTFACLRGLDPFQLMKATPWTVFPYWGMDDLLHMPQKDLFVGAKLVVDGQVLVEPPIQAWKNGRGHDIPVVLTTTAQEVDMLVPSDDIRNMTWSQFSTLVREELTVFSPQIGEMALELYPSSDKYTPEYQYTSIISDMRATCPVHMLAEVLSGHFRSPIFRGIITARPSLPSSLFGEFTCTNACHAWDLYSFFGDFKAIAFHPEKFDLDFQLLMRQQIMTFARDGRPEAPVWLPFRTCSVLLSDHVFALDHYNKDRCDYWLEQSFFSYAWIN